MNFLSKKAKIIVGALTMLRARANEFFGSQIVENELGNAEGIAERTARLTALVEAGEKISTDLARAESADAPVPAASALRMTAKGRTEPRPATVIAPPAPALVRRIQVTRPDASAVGALTKLSTEQLRNLVAAIHGPLEAATLASVAGLDGKPVRACYENVLYLAHMDWPGKPSTQEFSERGIAGPPQIPNSFVAGMVALNRTKVAELVAAMKPEGSPESEQDFDLPSGKGAAGLTGEQRFVKSFRITTR